jgi:polyhydroxyalkanoate synthesis regulator protein
MDASNPVNMLSQITEQNLSMWQQAMDRFRQDQAPPSSDDDDTASSGSQEDER